MGLKDWLSLIAIVLSIITFVKNYNFNIRIRERDFAVELYKEILLYKIPESRNKIKFTTDKGITGIEGLQDDLRSLRSNLRYFKFVHQKIFEKLTNEIQKLEDFLVQTDTNKSYDRDDEEKWIKEVTKKIDTIYKILLQELPRDNVDKKIKIIFWKK
ncbi:hypothetical protein [Weissella paramesenteroides]|uniref:hypothetical protein n=1 Tax=Weissella paramesenteroides TaxID=1249 RepID=UPI00123B6F0A|nr:hypothetical protein [Weissella paramesenteroides]KAA8446949.1 hypothetical protein FKV72_03920 [Weissella paramesenteroides]KAA8450585.1 hypothetical protein FKV71_08610 [Weissella paramesenteroides]